MSKAVNFPHYKAYTLYTLSNNGAQFVIYLSIQFVTFTLWIRPIGNNALKGIFVS